jgi:hypothetical protein
MCLGSVDGKVLTVGCAYSKGQSNCIGNHTVRLLGREHRLPSYDCGISMNLMKAHVRVYNLTVIILAEEAAVDALFKLT